MSDVELVSSTSTTDYYVVRSAAKMPQNCWGKYEVVGIVAQRAGSPAPKQIRDTARGRVRHVSRPQFSGSTGRCAAERTADYYRDLCERLARAELRALNAVESADMHRAEGC